MKKNVDVIDLFDQELNKKDKKLEKKIQKAKKKEEKKNKKKQLELEAKEDLEFEEYLKKKKEEENNNLEEVIDLKNEINETETKNDNYFEKETIEPTEEIKFHIDDYIEKPIKEPIKEDIITKEQIIEEIKNVEIKKESLDELLNIKEEKEEIIEKPKKNYLFFNILIAISSIILLVISVDYIAYNCITNYKNMETMINSILLVVMVIFYLLSIIIKKEGLKKFNQLLSILAIIAFMGYHLFII